MRRAPKAGYDFSRKRDYRRKVWATFSKFLRNEKLIVAESHALLMPSLEGDEIEVAMSAGFREYNLHVVDQEPAVVATLKRKYPKINTYGVTVSRAMERIAAKGIRLRCVNLDFCSQLSASFMAELLGSALVGSFGGGHPSPGRWDGVIGESGAFDEMCAVAVSMLRGREPKCVSQKWKERPTLDRYITDPVSEVRSKLGPFERMIFDQTPHITALTNALLGFSAPDRERLWRVGVLLGLGIPSVSERNRPQWDLLRTEQYLSVSGQTIMWSIWRIKQMTLLYKTAIAADRCRVANGLKPVGAFYTEEWWARLKDGSLYTGH